jgi:Domain of unknown function (DUF4198)
VTRLLRRTTVAAAAAGTALLASAVTLSAHDFWLVPNAFHVAAGGSLDVRGQTGTRFPESEAALAPDRVAEARVVGANSDERVGQLAVDGKSLRLQHRPAAAGQYVVALAIAARESHTTRERLHRYIALEGAPELAERYAKAGAFAGTDSVHQETAKFAKTIVEVGEAGPRAFTRAIGQALELIPQSDPSTLRAGDTLRVRLLFHGQPVGGATLRAGVAAPPATPEPAGITSAATAAPSHDAAGVTDAAGIAAIAVPVGGVWNVRVLHAAQSNARWEVLFSTLVFEVRSAR